MLLVAALLALFPCPQTQEEKKPAPQAPAQEKKSPVDPNPQEEPKPQDEKPTPKELVQEEPSEGDLIADVRGGAWWIGKFEAFIPAGRRRIDSTLLFDAGIDVQGEYAGWTLTLTGDFGTGRHLKTESAGLLFGHKWILDDLDPILDIHVAAGPIFGRLDVDVSNFGDFKSALGFETRVETVAWLNRRVGLGLWADFRYLSFKFNELVLMGDEKTNGPMFAVGVSFLIGF